MVKKFLSIEGLVFFLFSLYFYQVLHGNWFVFIPLFFVPDVFMLGYLVNKQLGAILYNVGHTYITSATVLTIGLLLQNNTIILGVLILIAHISIDRTIGYGLKYSTGFKDTHLQKV